ncbi:hypothetical protein A6M27_08220 [Acidithiobacillus thiooxidans]|uniref:Uncharacterized protein n=1 Tax=Acidithiobacillus thiooxidans TaxID=930 RepID=A0A1C2I0A9_ACITH|nr:hypothetical protein A6O24_18445 [Acidithiobacillus thiooxidans]OCX70635.1 hypothetical protein A6P07_13850 [Acidithiobacillus thiooxidans]OCX77288.1 hypothetical protein A6O26_20195 [Acidithiobacillus thiooxidans]OCX88330.1 hypothetical protein A6M27_08220 [Acidithiobacillus thiooxidans]OFC47130.1 hypothetical protein BAE47_09135 [Acidithiobacillus thiooxidans]
MAHKTYKRFEYLYAATIIMFIVLKLTGALYVSWDTILLISVLAIFYMVGFVQYFLIKMIRYFCTNKMRKPPMNSL